MILFIVTLIAFLLAGFGLGGGVLLIPILLFMGFDANSAKYMALIGYIPAAMGVIACNRNNLKEIRCVVTLVPFGLLGVCVGALIMPFMSTTMIEKIYGIFLILFGVYMIWSVIFSKKTVQNKN